MLFIPYSNVVYDYAPHPIFFFCDFPHKARWELVCLGLGANNIYRTVFIMCSIL